MTKEIKMPDPSSGNISYKKVDLPKTGTYLARCYGMAHIGTVTKTFNNDEKDQNEIALLWELPTEKREFVEGRGEQPVAVHLIYNHSSNEKSTLYKHINIWSEGQINQKNIAGFNIVKLLGRYCLLSLEKYEFGTPDKDGNVREDLKVKAIAPVDKDRKLPEGINETFVFDVEEFDKEEFFRLPPLVRYEISNSHEFSAQGLDYEELKNEGKDNKPEEKEEDKGEETSNTWV